MQNADGADVHRVHIERERIIPDAIAFQMVSMLQDVIDRGMPARERASMGELARSAGRPARPMITATRGSWGSRPRLWLASGSVLISPSGSAKAARARALRIWSDFMRRVARRRPAEPFAPPADLHGEELCRVSYQRPVQEMLATIEIAQEGDAVPVRLCMIHEGTFKQRAQRAVEGFFTAIGQGLKGIFR